MPAEQRYIAPPIETDPDALAQNAFDRLTDVFPGWVPAEPNLDTIILETVAEMAAEIRDLASQVPTAIFRFFGASVLNYPPIDATPAYVTSTWHAIDTKGYTIDAGTQVSIARTGSEKIGFEVVTTVDINPGATATASGAVELQAIIPGIDGNGLTDAPEPVNSLPWVASIALQNPDGTAATTANGVDAELDEDYLNRLVQDFTLLSPRPITADNFATLYKNAILTIARAQALDTYDPALGTFGHEKTVTLIGVDAAGEPVSSTIKTQGQALFAPGGPYEREANFVVNMADPTYTTMNVTCSVTITSEASAAQVITDVQAALANYFSPANWGKTFEREALGALEVSDEWVNQTTVYYLELTTLVNNVEGVDRVVALTFNKVGSTLGTADVALTGAAPLTRPGAFTVTVV